VAHLREVRTAHPGYHCAPVPPFGATRARLLIVGLAPGRHGANATGRPFTGDHAGIILYRTLHEFGLASRPESTSASDDLRLHGCRITNAVKCLPPENRPTPDEVRTCNHFLAAELAQLPRGGAVLALGAIAHNAVVRALALRPRDYAFGHGSEHALPNGRHLVDSYHCSRYNTQTRRLTDAMFRKAVGRARALAGLPVE